MAKKTDKRWFAEEIKNHSALTWAHRYTGVPGCEVIEAIWNKSGYPIGTLWFATCGLKTVDITDLYVAGHYRRLGIATYLLDKLIAAYPKTKAVITGEGTKYSIGWLKKNGFKQNESDGWRLEIKGK